MYCLCFLGIKIFFSWCDSSILHLSTFYVAHWSKTEMMCYYSSIRKIVALHEQVSEMNKGIQNDMKTAAEISPHFSKMSSEALHPSDYKLYIKTRCWCNFEMKMSNTEEKLIWDIFFCFATNEGLKRNNSFVNTYLGLETALDGTKITKTLVCISQISFISADYRTVYWWYLSFARLLSRLTTGNKQG